MQARLAHCNIHPMRTDRLSDYIREEGMLRAGQVLPALIALDHLGVDAAPIFNACGIPHGTIVDPEAAISLAAACQLMAACTAATGHEYFGLLAARHASPSTMGVVGHLMLQHDDVGSAVCSLMRNLHLSDRGAVPLFDLQGGYALLGYVIADYHACGTASALDLAIGTGHQLMCAMCGTQWHASEIWLAHSPPAKPHHFEAFFRCPVRFDMPYSALLFPEADLARPIIQRAAPSSRAASACCAGSSASELGPSPPFALQVKRLLRVLLAIRRCSAQETADLMNVHMRTLNRRLKESGHTFRALADDARFDYARTLLHETRMSLPQIAAAVGYADVTTFNRRFRQRAGTPPGQWRESRRATH